MFGKERKVERLIQTFMTNWAEIQALDANLAGEREPPPIRPAYFAILYGAADSCAQSIGANTTVLVNAIGRFCSRFEDGKEMSEKILAASRSPELYPWALKAGQAVHLMRTKATNAAQALLPLAEEYRLAVAEKKRPEQDLSSDERSDDLFALWGFDHGSSRQS